MLELWTNFIKYLDPTPSHQASEVLGNLSWTQVTWNIWETHQPILKVQNVLTSVSKFAPNFKIEMLVKPRPQVLHSININIKTNITTLYIFKAVNNIEWFNFMQGKPTIRHGSDKKWLTLKREILLRCLIQSPPIWRLTLNSLWKWVKSTGSNFVNFQEITNSSNSQFQAKNGLLARNGGSL